MRTLVSVGVLVIFTVLTVILLKHQWKEIPDRDVKTSVFLWTWAWVASGVSMLLKKMQQQQQQQQQSTTTTTRTTTMAGARRTHHRQHPPLPPGRPPEFARVSNQLMQFEVLGTIVLPWILLKSSGLMHRHLHLPQGMVEHLLVPHLYFFQAQIAAEAVLFATHQDDLLFFYTCMANALRGLPLGSWILRSVVALESIQMYNPFHWMVVAGLPAFATALWLYSSLIFIPLKWYPVTREEQGRHVY